MSVHPSRTEPHPIEVARFLRGLTQRQLALRAGISREGLALIEGGGRSPRLATMVAIATALGVDIGTLFDGTELTAERLVALAGPGNDNDPTVHRVELNDGARVAAHVES